MRIVALSDIHGYYDDEYWEKLPNGDVLILAGDILCDYGPYVNHPNAIRNQMNELELLVDSMPPSGFDSVIFVPGNHEICCEQYMDRNEKEWLWGRERFHYLRDKAVTIGGVRFYGMPWQPRFYDWAFNLDRDGEEMREKVALIPQDTDVLITHGPPLGILDNAGGRHLGCGLLREKVLSMRDLKLHVFGHIHPPGGNTEVIGGTTFANVSICDSSYNPCRKALVYDLRSDRELLP